MKFEVLHTIGGLLFFLGTYFMVASYEEHSKKGKLTTFFMGASAVAYVLGSILISVHSL